MIRDLLLAGVLALSASIASASEVERVDLPPLTHMDATLAVTGRDGETVIYTPAEIEKLPTYRLVTATPWRDVPAMFEGVLLRDLLERHGLADLPGIRVTAENDYEVIVERAVWQATPVLLATRVDGRAHTRRARGPIQFMIGADALARHDVLDERHLVWMAAEIEPLD